MTGLAYQPRYLLDSIGRFAELLFLAHNDPEHIQAPSVLNVVSS